MKTYKAIVKSRFTGEIEPAELDARNKNEFINERLDSIEWEIVGGIVEDVLTFNRIFKKAGYNLNILNDRKKWNELKQLVKIIYG